MAWYVEHLRHVYGYTAILAVIALERWVGIVVTAAAEAFGGGVAGFAIGRLGNGGLRPRRPCAQPVVRRLGDAAEAWADGSLSIHVT